MIATTTKTVALIAAMSVLGTVTPAAFGQVNIFQSQSNTASNTADLSGSDGSGGNTVNQKIEQRSCMQVAGADTFSTAFNIMNCS